MKRGPSLFPPIIANMYNGRVMLFHDKQGGSVRVTADVNWEDSSSIWVRLPEKPENKAFTSEAQYEIPGSKGLPYTVTLNRGQWNCSCPGFGFRRKCKHVELAKEKHIV